MAMPEETSQTRSRHILAQAKGKEVLVTEYNTLGAVPMPLWNYKQMDYVYGPILQDPPT